MIMVTYLNINESVLKYIPSNKTILDVGCGSGYLSKLLKEKNNIVYGIDSSKEACEIAKQYIDKVICRDIEKIKKTIFKNEFFDIIIFSDILEHLKDPLIILKNFKKYLKDDGIIIISLPNIACWNVRLRLLMGQFNYTETGILDKTHLRFFIQKTAKQLVKNADLKIKKIEGTPYIIRPVIEMFVKSSFENNKKLFESKAYKMYRKFILPVEHFTANLWRNLLCGQIIIVCRK